MLRFREDGTNLGVVGSGSEINKGIALGPNGNLYVLSEPLGFGRIEQFDPVTGTSLGVLVNNDVFPFGPYQGPGGITFGADGNCYSTSKQTHDGGVDGVVKFDGTSGAFLGVVIAPDTNGLGVPNDVLTMPGGDLLVSDGSRINRYDGNTLSFEGTFVAPGSGGISGITKYTFGPDDNLYISSISQDAVYRFDGDSGAFMDIFVPSIHYPAGLTFGDDGQLYVVSAWDSVSVLRFDGTTGAALGTAIGPNPAYPVPYYLITAPVPEPSAALLASVAVATLCSRRPPQRQNQGQAKSET